MADAKLNITVLEKRMLKQGEAAEYTGIPAKHFKTSCPVQPVEIRPGTALWDKRDLDQWIDTMKGGAAAESHYDILARL